MKLIALAASAALASAQGLAAGTVSYSPASLSYTSASYQPYYAARPAVTGAARVGYAVGARAAAPAIDPLMMVLLLKDDKSSSKNNDNLLLMMMMGGSMGGDSMLPFLLMNKDSEDCPAGATTATQLVDVNAVTEAHFLGCIQDDNDDDLFLILMMTGGMGGSNSYLPLLLQKDVDCTRTAANAANTKNYAAACAKYNKDQDDDMLLMLMMNGGMGGMGGLW